MSSCRLAHARKWFNDELLSHLINGAALGLPVESPKRTHVLTGVDTLLLYQSPERTAKRIKQRWGVAGNPSASTRVAENVLLREYLSDKMCAALFALDDHWVVVVVDPSHRFLAGAVLLNSLKSIKHTVKVNKSLRKDAVPTTMGAYILDTLRNIYHEHTLKDIQHALENPVVAPQQPNNCDCGPYCILDIHRVLRLTEGNREDNLAILLTEPSENTRQFCRNLLLEP